MLRTLFTIWLALALVPSFAQKLYFAKANYQDSALLEKNIGQLAKQAILLYKNDDLDTYLDNVFRLQFLTGLYDEMNRSLKRIDYSESKDSIKPTIYGFAYQVYGEVLAASTTDDNFEAVYTTFFYRKYNALNEHKKPMIAGYFNYSIPDLKTKLTRLATEYQNTDSLTVNQAIQLCRAYLFYKTYCKTQPFARKILAKIDREIYNVQDSVLLKMPDGGTITLTIVADKKDTMPQPVVLLYNIYAGAEMKDCKTVANNGYIGVVANTRGKRLSKDTPYPLEYDAQDAYHIIDWISKQTWCNGKIGMYGGSYLGFGQWGATKYLHPALKTIVPQASVGAGIDFPMHNGVFMPYMLQWIHYVTDNKLTDKVGFNDATKWNRLKAAWYKSGKSFRSLDTLEGRPNAIFQKWLQHPSYDAYWQKMTPQKEEFAKINIPILSTTGYWDDDQAGAMYYYREHHKWNKNPNHYLVIGPYDHGGSQGYPSASLSNYTVDSVAMQADMDLVFDWFDYILKDKAKPAFLKDKVNFQIMGKNEWRSVPSLNKMADDTLHFYLTNAALNNSYLLSLSKPAQTGFISQKVDFKDRGDLKFVNDEPIFGSDFLLIDTSLHQAKHQLVFVSNPIDKPFAISGSMIPTIVASINKRDMDIRIELFEQTPEGKYFALNENLQRASFSKDKSKRQLLTPKKIEHINVNNTFVTCKQLQKGSRIVIMLGVNKKPSWQINYGSGKDVSDETIKDAAIPLHIKWYNSSCIKIPILRN